MPGAQNGDLSTSKGTAGSQNAAVSASKGGTTAGGHLVPQGQQGQGQQHQTAFVSQQQPGGGHVVVQTAKGKFAVPREQYLQMQLADQQGLRQLTSVEQMAMRTAPILAAPGHGGAVGAGTAFGSIPGRNPLVAGAAGANHQNLAQAATSSTGRHLQGLPLQQQQQHQLYAQQQQQGSLVMQLLQQGGYNPATLTRTLGLGGQQGMQPGISPGPGGGVVAVAPEQTQTLQQQAASASSPGKRKSGRTPAQDEPKDDEARTPSNTDINHATTNGGGGGTREGKHVASAESSPASSDGERPRKVARTAAEKRPLPRRNLRSATAAAEAAQQVRPGVGPSASSTSTMFLQSNLHQQHMIGAVNPQAQHHVVVPLGAQHVAQHQMGVIAGGAPGRYNPNLAAGRTNPVSGQQQQQLPPQLTHMIPPAPSQQQVFASPGQALPSPVSVLSSGNGSATSSRPPLFPSTAASVVPPGGVAGRGGVSSSSSTGAVGPVGAFLPAPTGGGSASSSSTSTSFMMNPTTFAAASVAATAASSSTPFHRHQFPIPPAFDLANLVDPQRKLQFGIRENETFGKGAAELVMRYLQEEVTALLRNMQGVHSLNVEDFDVALRKFHDMRPPPRSRTEIGGKLVILPSQGNALSSHSRSTAVHWSMVDPMGASSLRSQPIPRAGPVTTDALTHLIKEVAKMRDPEKLRMLIASADPVLRRHDFYLCVVDFFREGIMPLLCRRKKVPWSMRWCMLVLFGNLVRRFRQVLREEASETLWHFLEPAIAERAAEHEKQKTSASLRRGKEVEEREEKEERTKKIGNKVEAPVAVSTSSTSGSSNQVGTTVKVQRLPCDDLPLANGGLEQFATVFGAGEDSKKHGPAAFAISEKQLWGALSGLVVCGAPMHELACLPFLSDAVSGVLHLVSRQRGSGETSTSEQLLLSASSFAQKGMATDLLF
ncbi:unnamed protein product [Amoebophrya sp. A25]|nr:unnamed protein product [Amoebophrya sp. A25]|eukprot:GSA25T00012508001.1